MLAVAADVLLDLRRQLARRRNDEHADAPPAGIVAQPPELGEDRQYERGGLAGAGLSDADQVMSGKDMRDGGRLDRRGFGVTGLLDGFEDAGVEAKNTKRHKLPGCAVAERRLSEGAR